MNFSKAIQLCTACHQSTKVFYLTHSTSKPLTSEFKRHSSAVQPLQMSKMPGPGGLSKLPYIGPLFLFDPFSDYKPETYGALVSSLHDKHGPIFKTRLGKDFTVHTACIEDIDAIFRQEPMYPRRRLNVLSKVYRERRGLPQGLSTSNGPDWHALRTSLNAPLNRPQACMTYLPGQNRVTDDLVKQLQQRQIGDEDERSAQAIFDLLFRFSAESVAVVCFNERLGFLTQDRFNEESKQLLDAFYTHLNCSFKSMIGLERKFLRTEHDEFYQTYAAAVDYIREQSRKLVTKTLNASREAESIDRTQASSENNMLMTLVRVNALSMEQILAIIESLLIAGTDSTARNLSVVFYNLARHPHVQTQAANEVIRILGHDGPVTAESLAQMNFLKACIKESMRLYPPISPGTERILSRNTILSGYFVPEGTSVIMSSVKTGLDPTIFPDPFTFRPDRWTRGADGKKSFAFAPTEFVPTADSRLTMLAVLPFGHGKRSCVGRRFAEMELLVCVAKVLQKLHLSVDADYGDLKTIYTPFVTPIRPIPFVFNTRSNGCNETSCAMSRKLGFHGVLNKNIGVHVGLNKNI